jgi:hypothetical protein
MYLATCNVAQMSNKKKIIPFLKWTFIVCCVLFFILGGFAWYLNQKYKPLLTAEIKKAVFDSTDGLYEIYFSTVNTNIVTGNATLKNVKLVYNQKRFKELITKKRAPNNLYKVNLKKLVIKNFHPVDLIFSKELIIDNIHFSEPEVEMVNRQFDFNENRKTNPTKSPYEIISSKFNKLSIGAIDFDDVSLKYIDINERDTNTFSINKLNVSLKDFLIDKNSATDTSRIYFLKDIAINLNNYSYLTEDKLYEIKLKKLDFRSSTGVLKVEGFRTQPKFSEMDFGKKIGYRKDRFDIRFDNILLKGINLPLYIKKQELRATEMFVDNGKLSVFNNEFLPTLALKSKIGKYPHQVLQSIDGGILINKINLKDIDIDYALLGAKSNQRGDISFEHTSGTVQNLTNIKAVKQKDSLMEVKLTSYLMGDGKIDANFNFNLLAKDGTFTYSGTLHNTNARILNRITKPLGLLQINRGIVDKLDFSFKADDYKAEGKVNFWYYNLSVGLMRNDEERGGLVKMGIMSFLANNLMINPQNPTVQGNFITGQVNYQRPEYSSFFNLLWKSIFTGVKYSVGLTDEKQNKMRAHLEKFKAIKASKAERKQRRVWRENNK